MRQQLILFSILSGIISGVIIGLFLKTIERTTGVKVYTLLLNIDFIPIANQINFSEVVEFLFHLIVSVVLTVILYTIAIHFLWTGKIAIIKLTGMSIIVGILIYPITMFSTRTPGLLSVTAIFWWVLGHILYGLILGLVYNKINKIEAPDK